MLKPIRALLPAVAALGLTLVAAASLSGAAANPAPERGGSSSLGSLSLGSSSDGSSAGCPAATGAVAATDLTVGKSARACGLVGRLVTHNGVGVRVQPPGKGVSASADSASGGATLNVLTSPEGLVTADFDGPAVKAAAQPASTADVESASYVEVSAQVGPASYAEAATLAASTDPACSMTAKKVNGWRWTPGIAAKFLVNTTEGRPSNVSGATFLSIQKTAAARIAAAYNNCGIVADPSLSLAYSTSTTYNSNISGSTNSCTNGDGRSVLDFGSLSGTTLALNCTWYTKTAGAVYGKIVASDTRFDNTSRAWVTTTTGCTGSRFDLLSVATHEMGHLVGLGHVAEVGGSDLTMSPLITPCSASARTLGRGDVYGLMVPY